MIRFSFHPDDGLTVPTQRGKYVKTPYSNGLGKIDNDNQLAFHLKAKLSEAPVVPHVVMVHGFRFDVRDKPNDRDPSRSDNPHSRNFHTNPAITNSEGMKGHCTSWPLALGDGFHPVAFGWWSDPSKIATIFRFKNSYSRAYDAAMLAGIELGRILAALRAVDNRPIHIIGHSLGTAVIRKALEFVDPKSFESSKIILLSGAEYQTQWKRSELLGRVLNAACKGDDVLDRFGDNFGPVYGRCIGVHGLPGATNVWLDDDKVQAWLRSRGYIVEAEDPDGIADHWGTSNFLSNFELYAAWLNGKLTAEQCKAERLPRV